MFSHLELFAILAIVLIIFGPVLLPWLVRRLGLLFSSAKELKEGVQSNIENDDEDEDEKKD